MVVGAAQRGVSEPELGEEKANAWAGGVWHRVVGDIHVAGIRENISYIKGELIQ